MVSVFLRGACGHCISPESVPPLEVRILLSKCNFFATNVLFFDQINKEVLSFYSEINKAKKKKTEGEGKMNFFHSFDNFSFAKF